MSNRNKRELKLEDVLLITIRATLLTAKLAELNGIIREEKSKGRVGIILFDAVFEKRETEKKLTSLVEHAMSDFTGMEECRAEFADSIGNKNE